MEHCVFCAFLSKAPIQQLRPGLRQRSTVKLRDRVGAEHRPQSRCRLPQHPSSMPRPKPARNTWRACSIWARGISASNFVQETPAQVERTIARYRQLLRRREISGADLWKELKLLHQLGVTRGPMERAETISFVQ